MLRTFAYFWIETLNFSPEEITSLLQLEPGTVAFKGDIVHKRIVQTNAWELASPLSQETRFSDEHIKALITRLLPQQHVLDSLRAQGCEMGINCVGYYSNSPGFHLDHALIRACADLGLSLDFDIYCGSEE